MHKNIVNKLLQLENSSVMNIGAEDTSSTVKSRLANSILSEDIDGRNFQEQVIT